MFSTRCRTPPVRQVLLVDAKTFGTSQIVFWIVLAAARDPLANLPENASTSAKRNSLLRVLWTPSPLFSAGGLRWTDDFPRRRFDMCPRKHMGSKPGLGSAHGSRNGIRSCLTDVWGLARASQVISERSWHVSVGHEPASSSARCVLDTHR